MKLYSNSLSPNARRPRICAAELGIKLDVVELDFAKGDMQKPEYKAVNPMGKIPTLVDDDGYVLWESPAMLVYLANKYPDKGLMAADARGRAEIARWMFWNASHLESGVATVGFEKFVKPQFMGQPADEARVAAGTADWERFAPVLDAHLAGKDWICGKQLTIADICLGVTIDFAGMVGLDVAKHRNLASWIGRLRERASWKA